jgi:hypothetical protein
VLGAADDAPAGGLFGLLLFSGVLWAASGAAPRIDVAIKARTNWGFMIVSSGGGQTQI